MKIGIMTFFRVNNYGAVLQNYALQQVLMNKGEKVETIDYQCDFLENPYRIKYIKDKGLISYLTGIFGYITRLPREKNFDEFRRSKLFLSKSYNRENVALLKDKYDFFIAGSDQIWNVAATNGDMSYFLDFVDNPLKKGSYAASFARQMVEDCWKESIKKTISDFQTLLVREEGAKNIIRDLSGKDAAVVLDPTLLLEKCEWDKLLIPVKQNKKYVLVYQQSITKQAVLHAKKLSKKYNLEILCIPFPIGTFAKAKCKTSYAPGEWLWLIKNAEYIVTDSFHGMVFSIIFNKQFYLAVSNSNKKTVGRMSELLKKCELESRIIDLEKTENELINYEIVNKILSGERKYALNKIDEMLNKVRSI